MTNYTEEQLQQAVKNACLDEFVSELDKGLMTDIGERGICCPAGKTARSYCQSVFKECADCYFRRSDFGFG